MDPIDRAQMRDAEINAEALERRAAERAAELARAPALDCSRCGAPIGAERREAVPNARECITCARRLERSAMSRGRR